MVKGDWGGGGYGLVVVYGCNFIKVCCVIWILLMFYDNLCVVYVCLFVCWWLYGVVLVCVLLGK